jgi:hypothetical protein
MRRELLVAKHLPGGLLNDAGEPLGLGTKQQRAIAAKLDQLERSIVIPASELSAPGRP